MQWKGIIMHVGCHVGRVCCLMSNDVLKEARDMSLARLRHTVGEKKSDDCFLPAAMHIMQTRRSK